LRTELLAKGVIELTKAYTIVQDLDFLRSNYNTKSFDSKSNAFRISSLYLIGLVPKPSHIEMTSRARVLNGTT